MLNQRNIPIQKFLIVFVLAILIGTGVSVRSQSDPDQKKDSPVGLVVYCPISEGKDTPFDFERTLALWYKRYKAQKRQEGGGAILLVSAPSIAKNSPEIERLRSALGAEVIFPGSHSVVPKKEVATKAKTKKKTSRKTKKANAEIKNKSETISKPASPKSVRKKSKSPKVSSSKKSKPVIPPGLLISKEEGGIEFAFYSPSSLSLASEKDLPAPWLGDLRSQLTKNLQFHSPGFLLLQDPSPNPKEDTNPIAEGIRSMRQDVLDQTPSVVLLSAPRALRFFNGEYSFGCGATPNSLKLSVLEIFFRNGRLIRIAEEIQTLNSKESNKSWILE